MTHVIVIEHTILTIVLDSRGTKTTTAPFPQGVLGSEMGWVIFRGKDA